MFLFRDNHHEGHEVFLHVLHALHGKKTGSFVLCFFKRIALLF